jgi:hypothetical protein
LHTLQLSNIIATTEAPAGDASEDSQLPTLVFALRIVGKRTT